MAYLTESILPIIDLLTLEHCVYVARSIRSIYSSRVLSSRALLNCDQRLFVDEESVLDLVKKQTM